MRSPRVRVAVAGFGPFPGVPKNPSGEIARALGKMRRFPAAGIALDVAVFPTAYVAAERDLQTLLVKAPQAIVLFGVAARAKHVRVETLAHNRASRLFPDQARFTPPSRKLITDGAPRLSLRGPAMRMRAAIRAAGAKAELSLNAGDYLCNAVFYRALAATAAQEPAPLIFFIHVPRVSPQFPLRALIRAGEAAVWFAAGEALKRR